MSIWRHEGVGKYDRQVVLRETCLYCTQLPLSHLSNEAGGSIHGSSPVISTTVIRACRVCGWWNAVFEVYYASQKEREFHGAAAILRELDPTDVTLGISEVRDFLSINYQSRFEIHPRTFEEVVTSVFRDLGFHAIATAYSKDGGIDCVLNDGSRSIGVQVKRTENAVGVEQIRSLAGALQLGEMTEGVFVTTSRFTSDAQTTAQKYLAVSRPTKIELFDARRFLEALQIAQRTTFRHATEIAPDVKFLMGLPTYPGPSGLLR
jgi:restriction system protein